MSDTYRIYLEISRIVLPTLAILCAFLWCRLYIGSKKKKSVLCELSAGQNSFNIYAAQSIIGRSRSCDLQIPARTVSRKHAMLFERDNGWFICPLDGSVILNGREIDEPSELYENDTVEIAGTVFRFLRAPLSVEKDEYAPSGGLLLVVLTLFQLVMCGQICLRFESDLNMNIPLSFGLLIATQWLYFAVTRFFKSFSIIAESAVLFLCTVGLAITACIDPDSLVKQVACVFMGFVGFLFLTLVLTHQSFALTLRPYAAIFTVVILFATALFGVNINGSRNWLNIGGLTFQPSEFAKVAFVFSGSAALYPADLKLKSRLFFLGFAGACMAALAKMVDFGAVAIFFVAMIVILLMRQTDVKFVLAIIAAAVLAATLLIAVFPHIASRFGVWGHIWEQANGAGYQQTRTLVAAASGGLLGLGGGNGMLYRIVAADTDLVYGIVCEEWGWLIAFCVAACFVGLGLYAVRLAKGCRSPYFAISVCAAAAIMVFQTALNIFGSSDILPLTGVTIMFVSRGGTSLVAAFLLMAFFKGAEVPPKKLSGENHNYDDSDDDRPISDYSSKLSSKGDEAF